jgi:hypothetical protein
VSGNEVEIVVRSQDRSAEGFNSAERRASGLKQKFGQVAAAAGGMLAGTAIAKGVEAFKGFMSDSSKAASDLNESVNAVQQIFGKSADDILKWGKSNATAFGLSQRAFNELATPLGAGLKNAGLSMQDTTKWTVDLTKRAADMASVFNTDVGDALEAIQSGLRGEADPLERYGVGLSAAKVEAEALSETHKKSAKSLTDQELMTARLNLIMRQTNATAGDFANTSDDVANAQRIAAAKTEELQARIGQKLQPAVLLVTKAKMKLAEVIADKVVPMFEKVADWANSNPEKMKQVAEVIGGVLVAAFVAWAVAAASAAAATIAATWPVLAIVAAIAALAAGFIYAYKHSEGFREIMDTVGGVLRDVVWPIIKTVASFIGDVLVTQLKFGALAFTYLARFALSALGMILHAAAVTFGWVPGLGPKLQAADKAFGKFSASVNKSLSKIQREIVVSIKGNSNQFDRVMNGVQQRLSWANGRTVWVNVEAGNANARESRPIARATGGIVGQAATGGIRSNRVMTGEHGPEILDLPPGTQVHSNPDTERMMSAGNGGGRVVVELRSSGSKTDDFLIDLIRRAVRARGGSVQAVLG